MPTLFGISTRFWAKMRPHPSRIYYTNGGFGDELMLTAIAACARAAGTPIHVIATYPEIWRNNTDAASVQTCLDRWLHAQLRHWISTEVVHLGYRMGLDRSIAQQMADHVGVTLPPDWRPVLQVRASGPRRPRTIVVQNSCRGARYAAPTKEWPQERWGDLVDRLAPDYELMQIGTPSDPVLPGTSDLRGKTSLMGAAELIASARLFVGLESGLMHVAAAMQTPAVIIVGGRSKPIETCYAFNHNITRSPACVGCGLNQGCPHDLSCLDIPVAEVETAIRSQMALPVKDSPPPRPIPS